MIRVFSLLVCVGLLLGLTACDNVDITKVQNLLNPPTPTGEFTADHWIDLSTTVYFGQPTIEEREDGTYVIAPAGAVDSFIIMKFADGTTLRAEIMNRWDEGAAVGKIVESDPETGAPTHTTQRTDGTWDMYTEMGQALFTGAFHVAERHHYYQDGVLARTQDEQPTTGEAAGVGPYEGHVLRFQEAYYTLEMRDGKPYWHGVWNGGMIR